MKERTRKKKKRREEEKERAEEGEEDRPKRRRGRDAHINTCATQTKTLQRTALVADTILRHADTSILISPSGLSPRKRRPFVVYPSMKYICVYPRTSGTRRNDSIWSRSRGFTSVSRGATGSSRSRITLRNEGREREREREGRLRFSYAWDEYIWWMNKIHVPFNLLSCRVIFIDIRIPGWYC